MRPLIALLRSSHPGPVVAVTTITVLLGVTVGLDAARVALLGATMLLNQVSVGWANDVIDAGRDRAVGRTDKPIVRGEIPARAVGVAAGLAAAGSLGLSFALGLPFVLAHALCLAGGWAYDLGIKRTAFSAVPYLASFGVLPLLPTTALPEPALAAWWAVVAGALLGLAAHVANVLPDLEADARTGVRGMPHRLGATVSVVLAGAALAGAGVAVALGIGTPLALAGLVVSLAVSAAAVVLCLRRKRAGFRLVMVAALVDVVLLVLAGPALAVPFSA